jgi:hypothetical protein
LRTVFLLFVSSFLHSQTLIGVLAGGGAYYYGGGQYDYFISNKKSNLSFDVGAFIKLPAGKSFRLGVEVDYLRKSNSIYAYNTYGLAYKNEITGLLNLDYLSINVLPEWDFKTFFINSGPYVNILANTQFNGVATTYPIATPPFHPDATKELSDILPGANLGFAFTIGWIYDLDNFQLGLNIRATHDFPGRFSTSGCIAAFTLSKKTVKHSDKKIAQPEDEKPPRHPRIHDFFKYLEH